MNIYTIRQMTEVDGEAECSNFDVCYKTEAEARAKMLEDFDAILGEANDNDYSTEVKIDGPDGSHRDTCDYCRIAVDETDTWYQWWIDKLELGA